MWQVIQTRNLIMFWMLIILVGGNLRALAAPITNDTETQRDYERSIEAVVRNKFFYKSGRMEAGVTGGVMPYDSVVNHYMLGGKFNWHLSDHYGWEVLDVSAAFPAITGFATNLVKAKNLSVFETSQLKLMATTNFLLSPFYGKIRFIGTNVLFFDVYIVAGGGLASTETIRLTSTGTTTEPIQSTIRSGMEPVFDFGVGFKIFMNSAIGLMIDFRDYMIYGEVYGRKAFKSNFSVFAGLSFFLPTF